MSTTPFWHADDPNYFNVVIIGSAVLDPSSTAANPIYLFGGWQGPSPAGNWFLSASDTIKWNPAQVISGQSYSGAWNSFVGGGAVFKGPARSGVPAFPYQTFDDSAATSFISPVTADPVDPTPAFWEGRNVALTGNAWMAFRVFAPDFLSVDSTWKWALHYWNTQSPITSILAPPTNLHIIQA